MSKTSKEGSYGFVYLWLDKKQKRFYVGSHWGFEDDGYVCSNPNMKENRRYRPETFKRRVLSRVYTNRHDLLIEEQRFLDMIKPEEFGRRYYNKNASATFYAWWMNEETKAEVGRKISNHPTRGKKLSEAQKGKIVSEETKEKLKVAGKKQWAGMSNEAKEAQADRLGRTHAGWNKGLTKETNPNFAVSEERKKKVSEFHKGRKRSEETRQKLREKNPLYGETIKCPHCPKQGNLLSMKRWHFDNCKMAT